MPPDKPTPSHSDTNISVGRDVNGVVVVGNENTVNQTIIQKFFNIFKSDVETLEQRNRRILLNHVENAWIKGVLDASLYGAAMLDLGIKETPEAITNKYPWALKKESTNETLPAGTSMLEIFDSIGMGRSLLILGAPGSGKTTMLLELARGLIARAREDVTQPIPMVFNLASWTEKHSLADWLAQEVNNLYSVPRKTAPDWVKGNKLLLLLDGLDEVRQESRAKCVEAINVFRKEYGLTSLAVCSRSQDYADLKAKLLAFEGAIEVQPLTQEQIAEFFNRFGVEMAGIKQALEKDSDLREMAETPLFLSIMLMAYRDKQDMEILISGDEEARHKHLFDTYIERMFEHRCSNKMSFEKPNILAWLSWLARKIGKNNISYKIEFAQPGWLDAKWQYFVYIFVIILIVLPIISLINSVIATKLYGLILNEGNFFVFFLFELFLSFLSIGKLTNIQFINKLLWDWKSIKTTTIIMLATGGFFGLCVGWMVEEISVVFGMIMFMLIVASMTSPIIGLRATQVGEELIIKQRIALSIKNSLIATVLLGVAAGLVFGITRWVGFNFSLGFFDALAFGVYLGTLMIAICGIYPFLRLGGGAVIKYCVLYLVLAFNKTLPLHFAPFLDHCVDLIFLRRVGGGYIFIHRLLMEHFAEMYMGEKIQK